jgi:hypothetical protein
MTLKKVAVKGGEQQVGSLSKGTVAESESDG